MLRNKSRSLKIRKDPERLPLTVVSFVFLLFSFIFLFSCSTTHYISYRRYGLSHDQPPPFKINTKHISNAVPKKEPLSKRGNPRSYVVFGRRYYVMKSAKGYCAKGTASWYGMKFHRFQTSSGELYNVAGMTAAHKTLPLPTYVQVTNLRNGKKIIVKVNDRGPFIGNRLIDLSYAAAKKLDMANAGTAPVSVRAITPITTSKHRVVLSSRNTNHPSFIRLGLFKQRASAKKLALTVTPWTQAPIQVQTRPIHQRIYYQVVIGPLPNIQRSQQLRHQLQLAGLDLSTGNKVSAYK